MSATKPRIYIEACPLIDMAKHEAAQTLNNERGNDVWYCQQLLLAARNGDIRIYTSSVSIAECTTVEVGKNCPEDKIKRFYDSLLLSGKSGIYLVEASPTICERARNLRWVSDMNLKGADAIHAATALHMKCGEILTRDGRLPKNRDKFSQLGITVCGPSETKLLPDEYRQQTLSIIGDGTPDRIEGTDAARAAEQPKPAASDGTQPSDTSPPT